MRELKIFSIKNNRYLLIDKESKNEYLLDLYFFDIDFNVEVGDTIIFNEKLLDKNYIEYSEEYYFGGIEDDCGREINSLKDTDLIAINKDYKKFYLKRLYG